MKKILKKASLLLFSIVLVFGLNAKTVAARETRVGQDGKEVIADQSSTDGITTTYKTTIENRSTTYGFGIVGSNGYRNTNFSYRAYYDSGRINNSNFYLYCLDPANWSDNKTLYAKRFLLSPNNGLSLNTYDTAVMAVLTSEENYAVKSMVIRVLSALWGYEYGNVALANNIGEASYTLYAAYFGQALEWIQSSEINGDYNRLLENGSGVKPLSYFQNGKITITTPVTKVTTTYNFKDYGFTTVSTSSFGDIIARSKTLFASALKEAADYAQMSKNGVAAVEVDDSIIGIKEPNVITPETDLIKYQKTYNFNLKNFHNDEKAYFAIDSLAFDEGYETVGAKSEPTIISVKINDQVVYDKETSTADFVYSENLLNSEIDYTNDLKIEVIIEIEAEYNTETSTISCATQPMEYTLKYSYNDSSLTNKYKDYLGIVWKGADTAVVFEKDANGETVLAAGSAIPSQRFVTIEKITGDDDENDGKIEDEIKDSVNLLDCDCEILVENCIASEDWESQACKDLQDANCDACDELEAECTLTEDEEVCSTYEEQCLNVDCKALVEACIQTEDWESDECIKLQNANCSVCEELEAECATTNDEEVCSTYKETCTAGCETKVENEFNCCDANNQLVFVDETKLSDFKIEGPEIQLCFVDRVNELKDTSDTSYLGDGYKNVSIKDEKENSYSITSNKYCAISCKEDYAMKLPTAKLVNAGRYFTFSASIEGTKTCVTNKIDVDQYNKDIEEIIPLMEKAFNEYNKYRSALEQLSTRQNKYANYTGSCDSFKLEFLEGVNEKSTYTTYKFSVVAAGDLRTVVVSNNGESTYNWYDEGIRDGGSTGEYVNNSSCSKSATPYTATTPGEAGDIEKVREPLNEKLEEYKKEYEQLAEALDSLQLQYSDCSIGEWVETEILYEPDVTYDYQEKNYMDMIQGVGLMEEERTGVDNTLWYCNGTLQGNDYDNCNGTNSLDEVEVNYVECDLDAGTCQASEKVKLPTVEFVKKISSQGASYKPKTLFYNIYPTGEITTDENATNAVALENELPVSLSTERGMYEYDIRISNLGEFYSSNEAGRLAGDVNKAVLSLEEFSDLTNYTNNSVSYNCSYLVNMGSISDEMIACDFDCGDQCIVECIGPNCDNYCPDGSCLSMCIGVGCIYDNDDGSYLYEKQVTLNNIFPEGTDAYNWDASRNEKAKEAIDAIQTKGNDVYLETPILSVTINPELRKAIIQYNKDNDGDYTNNTLLCYNIGEYEKVACLSSFITDLLGGSVKSDKNETALNITINDSIIKNADNRKVENYFELWSGTISEDIMFGPSFK